MVVPKRGTTSATLPAKFLNATRSTSTGKKGNRGGGAQGSKRASTKGTGQPKKPRGRPAKTDAAKAAAAAASVDAEATKEVVDQVPEDGAAQVASQTADGARVNPALSVAGLDEQAGNTSQPATPQRPPVTGNHGATQVTAVNAVQTLPIVGQGFASVGLVPPHAVNIATATLPEPAAGTHIFPAENTPVMPASGGVTTGTTPGAPEQTGTNAVLDSNAEPVNGAVTGDVAQTPEPPKRDLSKLSPQEMTKKELNAQSIKLQKQVVAKKNLLTKIDSERNTHAHSADACKQALTFISKQYKNKTFTEAINMLTEKIPSLLDNENGTWDEYTFNRENEDGTTESTPVLNLVANFMRSYANMIEPENRKEIQSDYDRLRAREIALRSEKQARIDAQLNY